MDPSQKLSQSWDANAQVWTRAVREGLIPSRKAATDAAILDAIRARAPKRLLDMGCGEGWLVRAAREMGADAVGIDGSEALIEAAQKLDPLSDYLVLPYEDAAEDPDALGGPFDAITLNYALLGETIQGLLATLATCLTPSGAILIQTLHPWSAADGRYEDGWRTEDFSAFEGEAWEPMPWYFRTLASWQRVIAGAGLRTAGIREPAAEPGAPPLSILFVCERT
jgi:2-polyprenyl-3-methyl-5-hydroxy-6-metoxy-1,4-benzoquinol methylase